jgi:hypothetical protein
MNIENMNEIFKCPISFETMTDPVTTPNGDSYQRECIERWIREKGTCPISRKIITLKQLVPNKALKRRIEASIPSMDVKIKPKSQVKLNLINRIFNSSIERIVAPSEVSENIHDMPLNYDFAHINCAHSKRCILFAYNTLNRIEKWNELRNFVIDESCGFQSGCKNNDIIYIMDEIERDYQGHSGSSMGFTMCHIHFISQYGLQDYKNRFGN